MELSELTIQQNKIQQLCAAGINNIDDLLKYLPKKYYDFRNPKQIMNIQNGDVCAVICLVYNIENRDKYIRLKVRDENNSYMYVYMFGRKYAPVRIGDKIIVCGQTKISEEYNNCVNMYPMFISSDIALYQRIVPIYKKIKGMSDEYLKSLIDNSLKLIDNQDYIDDQTRLKFNIISEYEAYTMIHKPKDEKEIESAKYRFVFDDLYLFANQIQDKKTSCNEPTSFPVTTYKCWNEIIRHLEFKLTQGQIECLEEIKKYMHSGKKLNALLQGDVGSGKTIVAIFLLALAVENGYQCCIIAPTEILAKQHFEEIQKRLSFLRYNIGFLTGSLKSKQKKETISKIKNGEIKIVVGTHAVIQKDVEFKNLGMLIIDEQHRFGVEQREILLNNKENPHVLSMSATPIPRTLSMTLYGETIQVYNITTKPKGRKPVETQILTSEEDIRKVILHEVHAGHQCYVICPLIETSESEKMADVESVTMAFNQINASFKTHPEVKPVMINGNMSSIQIEEQIGRFSRNEANVLISTTIVEVGVDVPNATAIIIKNSERFGLAQLHQLRGRVGRSNYQSYCILQTVKNDVKAEIMCSTTDGFDIAKYDLDMRGPGQYVGTKQSGQNKYIMLSIAYPELFQNIRKYCERRSNV